MKHKPIIIILLIIGFSNYVPLYAQDSTQSCKVEYRNLIGTYAGGCKNGWANGKGEARGIHHYIGSFKNGSPNGEGTYYYSDSIYHIGNFQNGLREGKGVAHYLRNGSPDSVVKGYWSADEYRGKNYTTYYLSEPTFFDRIEINPSSGSGKSISIEITTTSGAPNNSPTSLFGGSGYVLTVSDVNALDGSLVRKLSTFASANKFTATYELLQFPVRLQITLSNGKMFYLELYKNATWTVRIYVNK